MPVIIPMLIGEWFCVILRTLEISRLRFQRTLTADDFAEGEWDGPVASGTPGAGRAHQD